MIGTKDKMEKKQKIMGVVLIGMMAVWAGVSYLTHHLYPFIADDLWYSTNLVTTKAVSSVGDIVESQIWHYFNWGGRSISHSILQLTLWSGETIADILNVIVTFLLAFIICKLAGGKGLLMMFLGLSAFPALIPGWEAALFWQSGTANYLYISVFVFLYLYLLFRYLRGEKLSLWLKILSIPLGFIAGWSNENVGPAVFILAVMIILIHHAETKKVDIWILLSNIACLAGSVLLLIAPGNSVRGAYAEQGYGIVWRIFLRCYAECRGLFESLFPLLIIVACVFAFGRGFYRIKIGKERGLLLFGALLTWGALILSPVIIDRAYFGTALFLLAFIISYLKDIIAREKRMEGYVFGLAVILWLRSLYMMLTYVCTYWGWIK